MGENETSEHDTLAAKQNLETAKIGWQELQKFFAQGVLILADASLDLIAVATKIAEDDKKTVDAWMDAGKLGLVTDVQAKYFFAHKVVFWSTVVKPFVLVQVSAKDTIH